MEKFVIYKVNEDGSKSPLAEFASLELANEFISLQGNGTYSIEKVTDFGVEIIS